MRLLNVFSILASLFLVAEVHAARNQCYKIGETSAALTFSGRNSGYITTMAAGPKFDYLYKEDQTWVEYFGFSNTQALWATGERMTEITVFPTTELPWDGRNPVVFNSSNFTVYYTKFKEASPTYQYVATFQGPITFNPATGIGSFTGTLASVTPGAPNYLPAPGAKLYIWFSKGAKVPCGF